MDKGQDFPERVDRMVKSYDRRVLCMLFSLAITKFGTKRCTWSLSSLNYQQTNIYLQASNPKHVNCAQWKGPLFYNYIVLIYKTHVLHFRELPLLGLSIQLFFWPFPSFPFQLRELHDEFINRNLKLLSYPSRLTILNHWD